MQPGPPPRDARSRALEFALWAMLAIAIGTVIVMTWHPWVVGQRRGCPAQQQAGWDGRCRPDPGS